VTTLTTIAPTIDANGITAPTYAQAFSWLQSQYQSIYGTDAYLEPDSKDGQFLGVIAKAISDTGAVAVSVYNQFSPGTAQGAGLSSVVKINGIQREASSNSTVDINVGGQSGTTITNGFVKDPQNNQWSFPGTVEIPVSGSVVATATCQTAGAISAPAGTVWTIGTPTRGWQTATNTSDAAEGAPVEMDAALRARQTVSTAIPSLTVFEGIIGAVANVPGVTRYQGYENDTDSTNSIGISSHTICLVVEGGDATAIADAIASKKTPGGGTFGTTPIQVLNKYGIPVTINFDRPTDQAMSVAIVFKALTGYTSTIGAAAQAEVAAYINSVAIGGGLAAAVEWDACIAAAKSVAGASTFKIVSLTLSGPSGAGTPDVPLAFNQAATCTANSVVMTPSS
jgi:uncharacterized phage protein gp47/JayE